MEHDIFCVATDRLTTHRMAIYGGYNIFPNIDKIAKKGTIFKHPVACSASTLSCHACEWTGKNPWELHDEMGVPYENRDYDVPISVSESLFTDLIEMGYDVNLVFMHKPDKYFPSSYQQIIPIFQDAGVNVHGIPEWDIPQGSGINRAKHLMYCAEIIEKNRKAGKKSFVWTKIAGMYQSQDSDGAMIHLGHKYHSYAGQTRVTRDDVWQCALDEAIGKFLEYFGYGSPDSTCPEVVFSSDHGAWYGERGNVYYGYDLHEEIIRVPLISSFRLQPDGTRIQEGRFATIVDEPFSMRRFRDFITEKYRPEVDKEELIYAETLFPGQVVSSPGSKHSKSKTCVRKGKYKYIYNPFGEDGMSEVPTEELYDIEYDPHEKFNLANHKNEWFDCSRSDPTVACDGKSGLRYCDVLSRFHSDVNIVTSPEDPPEAEYCTKKNPNESGSGERTGWSEVQDVLNILRTEVKDLWYRTGRTNFYREIT